MSLHIKDRDGKKFSFTILNEGVNPTPGATSYLSTSNINEFGSDMFDDECYMTTTYNGISFRTFRNTNLSSFKAVNIFDSTKQNRILNVLLGYNSNIGSYYSTFSAVNTNNTNYSFRGWYYPILNNRNLINNTINYNDGTPNCAMAIKYGETPGNITALYYLIPNLISKGANITGFNYIAILKLTGDDLKWINSDEVQWTVSQDDSQPVVDNKGSFDNSSDAIDIPSIADLNSVNVLNQGSIKAYLFNEGIPLLNNELYSQSFFETIFKIQNSPIDNIQRLHMLPIPTGIINASDSTRVYIGNYETSIVAPPIVQEFYEFDCGELKIDEYYGNALDYQSRIEIYLPFIGFRQLDAYDVMNATIKLIYRFDIVTGNCVALIKVSRNRDNTELNAYLYAFDGNMSVQFPLTQETNKLIANVTSALNPLNFLNPTTTAMTVGNLATQGITSAVAGTPVNVSHGGALSVVNGYMSILTPYVRIARPVNVKPTDYSNYYGLPSNYTRMLSELSGYTVINELIDTLPESIPLNIRDRIIEKLKNGVYL